jgi:hypothetical protein
MYFSSAALYFSFETAVSTCSRVGNSYLGFGGWTVRLLQKAMTWIPFGPRPAPWHAGPDLVESLPHGLGILAAKRQWAFRS